MQRMELNENRPTRRKRPMLARQKYAPVITFQNFAHFDRGSLFVPLCFPQFPLFTNFISRNNLKGSLYFDNLCHSLFFCLSLIPVSCSYLLALDGSITGRKRAFFRTAWNRAITTRTEKISSRTWSIERTTWPCYLPATRCLSWARSL